MRATDIHKTILKIKPAEKQGMREYLINALTASFSTAAVLKEINNRCP